MMMLHDPVSFTINLAPVTKKNSQRMIQAKGRIIPIPSKQYVQYERAAWAFMPTAKSPIDYPINIKALYYMPTRRRVDLTNLHEALHDVLVKHRVIVDDNCSIVVSTDGSRVFYDKENPRTEVYIEEMTDTPYQIKMELYKEEGIR